MKLRALLAAAVVLTMVTSAQAVQLVVMAVNNSDGIAGAKTFTIGVKIALSDVTAPGAGSSPPLFAQNITFTGDGVGNPYYDPNQDTNIQDIQNEYINPAVKAGKGPPTDARVDTAGGTGPIFQGSWWYTSPTALLNGDINGNPVTKGTVTTTTGYTYGPTANVGTTGYLFQPEGTGIVGGLNPGDTMSFSGLFGPTGANGLDAAPLSALFSGGFLTVALAQVTAIGDVPIPDSYLAGKGQFLSIGQVPYDLSGAPAGTDTPLILNFAAGAIQVVPEPATLALAGLGAIGLLVAGRCRKRK